MKNLIIKNDNDIEKVCTLKNVVYVIVDKKVLLNLITTQKNIKYSISTDIREKNIEKIFEFIKLKVKNALNNVEILHIREDLKRDYIFIEDNDTERQFTAFKDKF